MANRSILVCGGCGFIGSNFVHAAARAHPGIKITVADALTYAGSSENLGSLLDGDTVKLLIRDISDYEALRDTFHGGFDLVINFAAETHVDRSLYYTSSFVRSNIVGVDVLLSLCREFNVPFLQISTDEVYGPTGENDIFREDAPLNPSSPYASSKASADLLILSAIKTFGQNAAIVRATNNYGPRQFPEKLIPFFIHLLREGQPLPVYGDGLQRRSWFHVEDFCSALLQLIEDLPSGEVFNIGASREFTNLEVVKTLIEMTGGTSGIKHVADRPAHDRRYFIDSSKFITRYGSLAERDLRTGLKATVDWYLANPGIFERLRTKDNQNFHEAHYRQRS